MVSYQQMLFEGHFDHWAGLLGTAVVALASFVVGVWLFDRLRDTLAEEV
jgi:ABC-type polysaccharide/polyol phosphate export permease